MTDQQQAFIPDADLGPLEPASPAAGVPHPRGTAQAVMDALVRHYTGGSGHQDEHSHLLFPEVQAPGSTRRADLVAISVWASRGRAVDVHEIKISRSDWLTELRKPGKAEAWWPHSTRFWLVVPDVAIVKDGELPDGWGLMTPPRSSRGRVMQVHVQPVERDPEITLDLLCHLLNKERQAAARERHELRLRTENAERQQGYLQAALNEARGARQADPETQERLRVLAGLEQLLGHRVDTGYWSTIPVTRAAAALTLATQARGLPDEHQMRSLEQLGQTLTNTAAGLRAASAALRDQLGADR